LATGGGFVDIPSMLASNALKQGTKTFDL